MSVKDWGPRALPSKERCERWHKSGGMWHYTSTLDINGVCVQTIRSPDDFPHSAMVGSFRPWKDGNPVTWSEFYAATHPPIPEGWEKVGEWMRDADMVNDGRPGLLYVGIGDGGGVFNSGDCYRISVRRLAPPITLADVPDGVEFQGAASGRVAVSLNGAHCGYTSKRGPGVWFAWYGECDTPTSHPSQPAAIVHLTGRKS